MIENKKNEINKNKKLNRISFGVNILMNYNSIIEETECRFLNEYINGKPLYSDREVALISCLSIINKEK